MTRAQLQTWIQAMGFSTDTDTIQEDFLLRALQELEGRRDWRWLEDFTLDTGGTLTIGNNTLAFPTNTKRILQVLLREPGVADYHEPLLHIRTGDWAALTHTDRDNGVPRYWTTIGSTIYFHPRPDKAYPVSLHRVLQTATTSFDADGESPPFDERFHIILGWRVVQWLATRQRQFDLADRAKGEYEAIAREMEQKDVGDRAGSHIRRSDQWDYVRYPTRF